MIITARTYEVLWWMG